MTPTNVDLRPFILSFFSDEELETLCFDYFPEAQQNFSGGMTKNRKALLLIGYCDTRGRLADLIAALERERPTAWREKFGAPPVETFRRNVSTPPDRRIHEETGIELVRIPAGPFLYGDDKKTLELPEFWIGRSPVTNAQYKRFLDANPDYSIPFYYDNWAKPYNWDTTTRTYPANEADYPVVLVSWDDVKAFCDWSGLRLPAEQEWEKAARGDKDGRIYPWGDDWMDLRCNTSEGGVGGTTRVGQYSPQGDSPYGCADMAGNVWEWTASWIDQKQSAVVLRGGSWYLDRKRARMSSHDLSSASSYMANDVGFRVIAPVNPGS